MYSINAVTNKVLLSYWGSTNRVSQVAALGVGLLVDESHILVLVFSFTCASLCERNKPPLIKYGIQ